MNKQKIDTAVVEARRFLQRVEELKAEEAQDNNAGFQRYAGSPSKARGALRTRQHGSDPSLGQHAAPGVRDER